MAATRKIAALVEEFTVGSPAQQLVDRLLIGYPRAGRFQPAKAAQVTLHAPPDVAGKDEIDRRVKDHGLRRASSAESAIADADGIVVVPRGAGDVPAAALVDVAVRGARAGVHVFVHGALAKDVAVARRVADVAATRKVVLLAGSYLPATWRLPAVDLEPGTPISEALIVVVGEPGEAELLGLDGLLPVIERRRGGEAGVRSVRALAGDAIWQDGTWSRELLAAAISRTNSPQGDPVKDGRTQDLVGLGLVEKLAREPVAYAIAHRDGLRSTVLVLNGVVADINFAVRTKTGQTVSAQLFRPPMSHQWSALAEVIEPFLLGGPAPWPAKRGVLVAGLLDALRGARRQSGKTFDTPALGLRYAAAEASSFRRE